MKRIRVINKYFAALLITAIMGAPFFDNVTDGHCHLNRIRGHQGQGPLSDIRDNHLNPIGISSSAGPLSEKGLDQSNPFCLFCICNAAGIICDHGFEILLLSTPFIDLLKTPAILDPTFPITKPPIC
jgi:hypothetical protein